MERLLDIPGEGRRVICIAGPTASGKSGLAVRAAKAVDGEVINADALQVYADISILSARPDESDMDGVPHHLFGHVSGDTLYSVGDWQSEATGAIRDVLSRGRTPILCGGTGLYFQALLQGLADIPDVPRSISNAVDVIPTDELRREAEEIDPVAAERVLGDDPQRLGRIVAVFRATGRALTDWRADTHPLIDPERTHRVVLLPDRVDLYARIERRFDAMVNLGGLREAERVWQADFPARAPMLKAIGLSHLLAHLKGEMDLDTAIDLAKRDTRRLAKRQMTWFRNSAINWTPLHTDADMDAFVEAL